MVYLYLGMCVFLSFPQLGPWLAVEIPDLIEKSLITHKEEGKDGDSNSK